MIDSSAPLEDKTLSICSAANDVLEWQPSSMEFSASVIAP